MLGGRGGDDISWDGLFNRATSVHLLPALGFLLALRCGAIDLSVWVSWGLAGVVAASLINAGFAPGWAFAAGLAAGLALGAVNAVCVVAARLPSIVVTPAIACLVMLSVQALVGTNPREIEVPFDTFNRWADALDFHEPTVTEPTTPVQTLRKPTVRRVVVGAMYIAALLALLFSRRLGRRLGAGSRLLTGIALCASGALAAAGGLCWLLDNGRAPVPTRLVDDLRIPVAAVVAGGAFLSGPGRTALAAAWLPMVLVVVTVWLQDVWQVTASGYWLQLLLLGGMVLVSHTAGGEAMATRRGRGSMAMAAAVLTAMGIVTLGGSVGVARGALAGFRITGMGLWLAGAVLLLIARARTQPGPTGQGPA